MEQTKELSKIMEKKRGVLMDVSMLLNEEKNVMERLKANQRESVALNEELEKLREIIKMRYVKVSDIDKGLLDTVAGYVGLVGEVDESNTDVERKTMIISKIKKLREKMEESGQNLESHKRVLALMLENGDANYEAKNKDVNNYCTLHMDFVKKSELKINKMEAELRMLSRKESRDEDSEDIHDGALNIRPTTSQEVGSKRKGMLESVQVVAEKHRKVAAKEKTRLVPHVFKTEMDENENEVLCVTYKCPMCPRKQLSAAAIVAHLEGHFPGKDKLLPCSFPKCNFNSTAAGLTRHTRSKHTGEKLFTCTMCEYKLSSYQALVCHEKKHGTKVQCPSCHKFHNRDQS